MGEIGHVVEKDNEFIKVKLQRQKACEKCRACAPSADGSHMILSAKNECDADVDDWVSIEIDNSFFLYAVLIMYGIPLVTMLLGFGAGLWAAHMLWLPLGEIIGFLTGVVFAVITYVIIRMFEHKIDRKKSAPVATHKVEPNTEASL